MPRLVLFLVAAGFSAAGSLAATPPLTAEHAAARITAAGAYATVERLTAADFAGRLTGTPGYAAAAAWAVEELRRAGLQAPPGLPDFLHRFTHTLGGVERAEMSLASAKEGEAPRPLELMKDYMPLLYSGSGDVTAEVVLVGYGITAPELGRDDYAGLDVTGKVVMALRGAPADGRDWLKHDSHRARTANARAHGAAAYLFAESAIANPNGVPIPDLPMASVSEEFAMELLTGKGLAPADLRKVLSAGGTASFASGRSVRLAVTAPPPREVEAASVVAWLPGSDPALRGEHVIVGAHLDHVGDWPVLLPGADDNASGSAAVLEIARAAARLQPRPRRSLVFVLFGGEETGLLGSRALAARPPAGLGRCVGVYNLDMVGAGTGAYVSGGENFPELYQALERARDRVQPGMPLKAGRSSGEPRADHGPFQAAGIPAVSLFGSGGNHHGYHTGEDTIWWITPKTIEAIARVVLLAASDVANPESH
jgi:hypothetical protein